MMSPTIVLFLLLLALVLPIVGAAILRLLIPRLSAQQFYLGAAAVFMIAVASVVLLTRSNINDVQVGNLTLVLPVSGIESREIAFANSSLSGNNAPVSDTLSMTAPVTTSSEVTTTVMPAPTGAVQATEAAPNEVPTGVPTATTEPTEAPTATEEPTAVPPTAMPTETLVPPTEAPSRRTYTVKKGDTLRSIAEQFDVSVAALLRANDMTAEDADSLRIDQELVIP